MYKILNSSHSFALIVIGFSLLMRVSNGWKTLIEDLDDSKYSNWKNVNGIEQESFICNSNIEILGGNWKNSKVSKQYFLSESADEISLQITYYIKTQAYLTININNETFYNGLISSAGQTNEKDFINCQGNLLYFQNIVSDSILNKSSSVLNIDILVGFDTDATLFMGLYKLKIKVPGISEGLLAVIIIIPTIAFIAIISFVVWKIRNRKKEQSNLKSAVSERKKANEKYLAQEKFPLEDVVLASSNTIEHSMNSKKQNLEINQKE